MPSLGGVVRIHKGDNAKDQLTAQEAPRCDQSNPSRHVDPPRYPRQYRHPLFPADDRHPMVLPARSRIRGEKLSQRGGEAEIAYAGRNEAPDDRHRPAAGQRERQTGRQRGPRVQDRERKTQHGQRGEVPVQLGLVAELCELRIVVHGTISPVMPLHDVGDEGLRGGCAT